jgi:hypothetical protein
MHPRPMVICAIVSLLAVCSLFFSSGKLLPESWSNALLPGFFLSALLLVKQKADFGELYVGAGLVFSTAIYTVAMLVIVYSVQRLIRRRSR